MRFSSFLTITLQARKLYKCAHGLYTSQETVQTCSWVYIQAKNLYKHANGLYYKQQLFSMVEADSVYQYKVRQN